MMSFGHLVVILFIILILFGARKVPNTMQELAKGFKAFRNELNSEGDNRKKKYKN